MLIKRKRQNRKMLFHGKPSVQKETKVKGRKRDIRCGDIDIDIIIDRYIDR